VIGQYWPGLAGAGTLDRHFLCVIAILRPGATAAAACLEYPRQGLIPGAGPPFIAAEQALAISQSQECGAARAPVNSIHLTAHLPANGGGQ
jgi:hypothetical protein